MTVEIQRTVLTATAPPLVYAYLADFTTTTHWDPGTVRTTLIDGDGAVGTRYANVSRFAGRCVELTYVVEDVEAERSIRLRAETPTVIAVDTIAFAPTPAGGTQVTYRAVFTFKGLAAFVAPLFKPAFRRLGDRAERGMQTALDALSA